MELNINCEAMRELAQAINTLAAALEAGNFKLTTAAINNPAPLPVEVSTAVPVGTVQLQNPNGEVAAQVVNIETVPVNPTPAPVQPMVQPTASVAQAVPTAAPSYTMEQLAVAATQLVDAGQRDNLVALLQQFGVQALNVLPKEQYGNFANALRGMGAKL